MNNRKRILLGLLIATVTAIIVIFLGSLKIPSDNVRAKVIPSGTFNYGGGTSLFSFKDRLEREIQKAYPQFKINLDPSAVGTSEGISELISGNLSFIFCDRPLTEAEFKTARDKDLNLEVIPFAIDGVAIYVNPLTQIKALTIENLQNIYKGKVENWQELGGTATTIIPISLDPSIDNIKFLWQSNDNSISSNFYKSTHTAAIAKVASTSGAIGYGSAAIVAGQKTINPVAISVDSNSIAIPVIKADDSANTQAFAKNIYPLTRRLYFVFPKDGSIKEKIAIAIYDFLLSDTGHQLIEQAGLAPIK